MGEISRNSKMPTRVAMREMKDTIIMRLYMSA